MKILIIGNGAREYSLALSLHKDPRVQQLYFAPGNGATELLGQNLITTSYDDLLQMAKDLLISLVVIGPEAPLLEGVGDMFVKAGFPVFGPSMQAALLEGSKAFMKSFAIRHEIPTAKFIETSNKEEAMHFIESIGYPCVIKADGLCAGKGVIIAHNEQEAMQGLENILEDKCFGEAGNCVVVEEYLDGFELSLFAISDSKHHVLLPVAQDHKRLLNGDQGPNTGGMGAYAPSPLATQEIIDKIEQRIVIPTLRGMREEKRDFKGVLFCGVMVVKNEPYLLEFNVRFGDPECEVILPLLKTPLLDLLLASANGEGLDQIKLETIEGFAMAVILATQEYPYTSPKPQVIEINQAYENEPSAHLCYAGVSRSGGDLLATGGRVIACVGVGGTLEEARHKAYALCDQVDFVGKQYRDDIGFRALS